MPANPTFAAFAAMLRTALGDALHPADSVLDMFAEDGVMEFPYAPPGLTSRVTGKPALRAYFAEVGGLLSIPAMADVVAHRVDDGRTFVVEFRCDGRVTATGRPYRQRYVSVVELLEGRIAHYRDYWNPLVILEATAGAETRA